MPVSGNFSTSRNQILVCVNAAPIEITLDPDAVDGDELHILRTDAEVTEKGVVNGVADRTINVVDWSDHLVYTDAAGWRVI